MRHVKCAENFGPGDLVQLFLYKWKREFERICIFIDRLKVYCKSPFRWSWLGYQMGRIQPFLKLNWGRAVLRLVAFRQSCARSVICCGCICVTSRKQVLLLVLVPFLVLEYWLTILRSTSQTFQVLTWRSCENRRSELWKIPALRRRLNDPQMQRAPLCPEFVREVRVRLGT